MASMNNACIVLILATLLMINNADAADPDIVTDFVTPTGSSPADIDAAFFTFTEFRKALFGAPSDASPFKVTKAGELEFAALKGQSVSFAALQYAPGGINPVHIHPRSAELLIVLVGKLKVGFVDSNNNLFTKILKPGDVFLFPKGLVHFQYNKDSNNHAVAVSAFGSSNAGTISLPNTLFSSGINTDFLAKSFKTDAETINELVTANMG
ncbi:hypothetical protein J5N97_008801 [Dioscorea zingiberensis]|uniref:Germin-like protein n=1 Tax=Dioscorea zingiberensis TaxID=325984 RepID=A0A9D5CVX5_9LILI|nr:hypothetical protein J5N97_008801 [Dioscorea zingiberensis]